MFIRVVDGFGGFFGVEGVWEIGWFGGCDIPFLISRSGVMVFCLGVHIVVL